MRFLVRIFIQWTKVIIDSWEKYFSQNMQAHKNHINVVQQVETFQLAVKVATFCAPT